ncbi:ABC-three component system middle component 8 [Demequina zhanjiangensis]
MKYDDVKRVAGREVRDVDYLFTPAVSLLFLLGIVEYRPTVDCFEYTGG